MEAKQALELLMEKIKNVSDEHLNDTFINSLKLRPDQVGLVKFVFWFCYMVETDLNMVIKQVSDHISPLFSDKTNKEVDKIFQSNLKRYRDSDANLKKELITMGINEVDREKIITFVERNYLERPVFSNIKELEYFSDKIKLYELLVGKTDRVKLLYKINRIRNDLSHLRVKSLSYKKKDLLLRETKEKLIEDYFETMFEENLAKSSIWNSLNPEIIREIERLKKRHPLPPPTLGNRVDEESN